ncbi:T9SS type A sorting domain-containing protein [bacterium]
MKNRCCFHFITFISILFIVVLSQNILSAEETRVVPNPFHSKTETGITFFETPPQAKITIFNVTGRRLAVLINHSDKTQDLHWMTDMTYGVFVYLIETNGKREIGKFYIM